MLFYMPPARSTVGHRLGHTPLFQGVTRLGKYGQAISKSTVPSAEVESAPEQLSASKLHHKQPAASRISNYFKGMGGAYTTAAALDEPSGSGRGLD